ncbi:hypothetical protein [Demetria terragena]|uniref:hypothetical protein n=1 Tax=Demetria terragena TaxID=63959 RepID=UPI000363FE23|nr:hypothetical protein [Demetria terragena]
MTRARVVAGAAAGATCVRLLLHRSDLLPGGRQTWERTNHAGRTVSLAEGPAVVCGTAAAIIGSPPAGCAAVASGGLGMLDDLLGTTESKGLRGHLRALRAGDLTTGAVKVVGLAAVGLMSAAAIDRRMTPSTLAAGAVIAGSANLINLFDLRPGRALKVGLVLSGPILVGGDFAEGVLVGTCLAALPEDVAAQQMMGDTGANAVGALLGAVLVERVGWRGRTAALALITGLTLASERVSFSRVIAGNTYLRRFDEWGRARS